MVKRILFTIPNFDTAGSGKALLNIATNLSKDKFEPHIMCRHNRGEFFKTVEASGIPIHIHEYITPMRPVSKGLRACWEMSRIFKSIGPDLVHSFHYAADYSEALAAKMAGCKWVYTKKNMSWGGNSQNSWRLRTFLADGIAVQNPDMIERFFRDRRKATIIPRGVNTLHFSRKPELPFNAKRKTIICVANLVPVKGVELLIDAFTNLHYSESGDKWVLKIVGDDRNQYGHSLKREYEPLRKKGLLEFTGRVNDVRFHLATADIFVLPTLNEGRMEGSPVSLLEAMSMGLIVLGSRIPGIKHQLKALGSIHLFKPGDVEDLTAKLQYLIDLTDDKRRALSQKTSAYCRSHWDISIEVQRHQDFYNSILGSV